jgi:hypothetical protein
MLRETRRDTIALYMNAIGPKLHGIAERVLKNLFDKKADLVKRTTGTRLGTSSPTDLFNLMSEHLKIAKDGGSYTLQRPPILGLVPISPVRPCDLCRGISTPAPPMPPPASDGSRLLAAVLAHRPQPRT